MPDMNDLLQVILAITMMATVWISYHEGTMAGRQPQRRHDRPSGRR